MGKWFFFFSRIRLVQLMVFSLLSLKAGICFVGATYRRELF